MNIPDLYLCKKMVEAEIGNIHGIPNSELLRIAKVLQRSIRPLVQRELAKPSAKRTSEVSHAHND